MSPRGSTRPGGPKEHLSPFIGRSRIEISNGSGGTYSITWRALVLLLVLAVAFVVLAPTLRFYLRQQAMESRVSEELVAIEARNAELEREIARWSDPAFIQVQARDRLGYVMPGQQTYMVVDPEVIIGEEAQAEYEHEHEHVLPGRVPGPWYFEVWDSIQIAGSTEPAADVGESEGRLFGSAPAPDGPANPAAPEDAP
ncbi:MAG TPA: septum formation initiator family protein [Actinomycetaceae bacterium]|nr:septum formation initiator family protein [Actinomycetaceae bacterium]